MPTAPVRRIVNGKTTWGKGLKNFATGAEAAVQRLNCRLKLILGEWFLDTTAGVPWFQPEDSGTKPILGANGPRDPGYEELIVKRTILGSDGIRSLESFSMAFYPNNRKSSIAVNVELVDGNFEDIKVTVP